MGLELAVVRVFKLGGGVAGSGFLVSTEYILTCAHVVAYCLASTSETAKKIMRQKEIPHQIIEVNFPIFTKGKIGQKLQTKVAFWQPRNNDENVQDIAVLKVVNPGLLPRGAKPINLIKIGNQSLWNSKFRALGFPKEGSDGKWAKGELRERVGQGLIQLEGTTETGLRLEGGFSGTAIWDERLQGVVGMAVKADQERPEAKVAFMIPTDLLLEVGDLANVCQVDGRIQQAIAILENYFLSDEIRYAYYQSLPENSIPLSSGKSLHEFPESLREMIQNLDNWMKENYSLLERFICFLLLHLQDLETLPKLCQELEKWLESYLQNHQNLMGALRKEKAIKNQQPFQVGEQETCLLVGAIEKSSTFLVKAWLIEDARNYTPENAQGCHSLIDEEDILINEKGTIISQKTTSESKKAKNLTELLQLFWADVPSRCNSNLKKISMFLPYKLIDRDIKPVDQYLSDENVPEDYQNLLGTECEVTVRFSERLKLSQKSNPYVGKFEEKWRSLASIQGEQAANIFHPSGISNVKRFFKQIHPNNVLAVRLTEMLQAEKRESIMEAFYYAGIPVALWMRSEAENLDCCEALKGVCQTCNCWSKLPEAIKAKRYEAWEAEVDTHIGNHLSLLWDDPNLVPPVQQLRMP
ncbi:trypsin-like peptidase domain-containing protein [Okeania sp. SIO1F9]|uniref:VMAP-C domain-containing protein n=1 Tax=Okeania sp. SIO1F9 TaxID=2607813 RepID=UPI00144F684C|nr:trypsin-like peptidase domain-containing protein [Okeania sp. SIO1F9]NET76848.1 trypsin-like peptidase domain-containing protein [Okeania sp. SIO1F9]